MAQYVTHQQLLSVLQEISGKLDHLHDLIHQETRAEAKGFRRTMKELDTMTTASQEAVARIGAAVAKNTAADKSIIEVVNRIAAEIRDNADDPTALNALADQLETDSTEVAAKALENTPAAPTT